MNSSFEKLFDEMCDHSTADYLLRQEENCKEFQELLKQEKKISKKIVKQLHQKELANEQEEIIHALEAYDQKWTYQKAFYDYTVLLRKMGVLSMGEDYDGDFHVDEKTYHKLQKAADKKGVSVEQLVRQSCEYYLTHLEETQKEEKRENK